MTKFFAYTLITYAVLSATLRTLWHKLLDKMAGQLTEKVYARLYVNGHILGKLFPNFKKIYRRIWWTCMPDFVKETIFYKKLWEFKLSMTDYKNNIVSMAYNNAVEHDQLHLEYDSFRYVEEHVGNKTNRQKHMLFSLFEIVNLTTHFGYMYVLQLMKDLNPDKYCSIKLQLYLDLHYFYKPIKDITIIEYLDDWHELINNSEHNKLYKSVQFRVVENFVTDILATTEFVGVGV